MRIKYLVCWGWGLLPSPYTGDTFLWRSSAATAGGTQGRSPVQIATQKKLLRGLYIQVGGANEVTGEDNFLRKFEYSVSHC